MAGPKYGPQHAAADDPKRIAAQDTALLNRSRRGTRPENPVFSTLSGHKHILGSHQTYAQKDSLSTSS